MFTEREAAGYLAGMIDGEGGVQSGTYRNKYRKSIIVVSTDQELIDATAEACDVLEIGYTLSERNGAKDHYKHQWILSIMRYAAIRRVLDLVPIRSVRKREALEAVLTFYETRKHPYHWFDRKPPRDVLEKMYVREQQSTPMLAAHFGCSATTVRHWLMQYEIPLRSTSESVRLGHALGRIRYPDWRRRLDAVSP